MTAKERPLGEVTLINVRLSFAEIYEKGKDTTNDDGELVPGKYKANGLMPREGKNSKFTPDNMKKLKAAKEAVLAAKYGPDQKKWPKIKADKICVRNGDEENWDGYEGNYYISASEKEQPLLLTKFKDAKGNWIPAEKGKLYSGCWCNLIVQLWVQDNKHGKRVNANLKAVQFVADDSAFSGAAPIDPSEAFAGIDADEGEDFGGYESDTDDDDDDDDGI